MKTMKWHLLALAIIALKTVNGRVPIETNETHVEIEVEPVERRQITDLPPLDENPEFSPDEERRVRPWIKTCRRILNADANSPSGMYTIYVNPLKPIQVYCEMGLNGGGYTFLSPESLATLTNSEVQSMFTDRTNFLLRVRKTDGTQPYAVLKQLPQYSNIPLKLGLSNYDGYAAPINMQFNTLAPPFLYFGFIPRQYAANINVQGLEVNGVSNTFTNCDKNPNSHFTLYPNFPERPPSTYHSPGIVFDKLFLLLAKNPSGRVMPPELFMFGETHWGGCGSYMQSNQIPSILSFSIGFR